MLCFCVFAGGGVFLWLCFDWVWLVGWGWWGRMFCFGGVFCLGVLWCVFVCAGGVLVLWLAGVAGFWVGVCGKGGWLVVVWGVFGQCQPLGPSAA